MQLDVIVIGSGQAGVPLATRLAATGKRVLIAERSAVGGTCINYGCTPTKTMVASARAAHVARTAARLGVQVGEVRVDLAAVLRRKNEIVSGWRQGIESQLTSTERLTLVKGHARFVAPREIEIEGQRYRADVVVINAGARPITPPLPGLDEVPWLDSTRIMEVAELPRHLIVLGGGYIGCEFGQLFRRFGSAVTVVDRNEHLMSREDPEVSEALEGVFRKEEIALELNAAVERVSKSGGEIVVRLSGGRELRGTHLLVATGRRPNTDELSCDAAGVKLDKRGFIEIDERYRTSADGVYAVGDVTGEPQFTHVSWDDHRILYDLLLGRSDKGRGGRAFPYTAFTDPQVAGVGLTEREAKQKGIAYEAATMPFGEIARAIELDETAGILKVLIDPSTERILGASIVGIEAGELIHIFVALMQAKASARAVVDAMAVHPTLAEGVQSVVMRLKRFALP